MDLYPDHESEILLRILLAIVGGGVIGIEREYRSKSAGFRTMILISAGSCLFTLLSMLISAPTSADRIASNIVTGIGFLGAGVIFRGDNGLNGITTAATIWVVAAVGMTVAAGLYLVAGLVVLALLLTLTILPKLEPLIERVHQQRTYSVCWHRQWNAETAVEELLRQNKLRYKVTVQRRERDLITQVWLVEGRGEAQVAFVEGLKGLPNIESFEA